MGNSVKVLGCWARLLTYSISSAVCSMGSLVLSSSLFLNTSGAAPNRPVSVDVAGAPKGLVAAGVEEPKEEGAGELAPPKLNVPK
jgi:hypothetical protein